MRLSGYHRRLYHSSVPSIMCITIIPFVNCCCDNNIAVAIIESTFQDGVLDATWGRVMWSSCKFRCALSVHELAIEVKRMGLTPGRTQGETDQYLQWAV